MRSEQCVQSLFAVRPQDYDGQLELHAREECVYYSERWG